MNGIHDMGGMDGFTSPERDPSEVVFKSDWERLVFGTYMSLDPPWSLDEMRFTMESMPAVEYVQAPYFGRWLWSIEKLVAKYGLATEEELENPDGPMSAAEDFQPFVAEGIDQTIPPRFRVGDDVIVKNEHPTGHTRMPRYVRGCRGTIYIDHGVYALPDNVAHDLGSNQQHCYAVMFTASELWGARANLLDRTYVDLWDDYLDAAP